MINFFKVIGKKNYFNEIAILSNYKNSQDFSPKFLLKVLKDLIMSSLKKPELSIIIYNKGNFKVENNFYTRYVKKNRISGKLNRSR